MWIRSFIILGFVYFDLPCFIMMSFVARVVLYLQSYNVVMAVIIESFCIHPEDFFLNNYLL